MARGKSKYAGLTIIKVPYHVVACKPKKPVSGALPALTKEEYAEACRQFEQETASVNMKSAFSAMVRKGMNTLPQHLLANYKNAFRTNGWVPAELDILLIKFVCKRLGRERLEQSKIKAIREAAKQALSQR